MMMGYNDEWRKWRKALHGALNNRATDQYKPIQNMESKHLMMDLLERPEGHRAHLERYAASVVVSVAYGRRVTDISKDEVVDYNRDAMNYLTSVK